jgi:phosphatidylglycerophosphatase C
VAEDAAVNALADPSPRPGLAVFDFDGTLTRRDTLLGFLVRVGGLPHVARALVAEARGLVAGWRDDARRDLAKAAVLARVLAGLPADEVDAVAREYGLHLVEDELRPDTRALVEWHRAQGHELCIVSASLEPYLRVVADRLGVALLACTELEVDPDGRLTGRLVGGNCRRAVKVDRLRSLVDLDAYEVWAYGDSTGDTELLAAADHPVWV